MALESCANGAQHYNKQKTILHACKHLVMFVVNLCRKAWVLRSTKVGRHSEISLKVSALLALESCAKGAQHHNKQKTILHACKHLVMFAVNLCRKVWVLRSTKVGRHFEILQKLCVLLAVESCAKDAQHHNKQKTILHACKHLVIFAVNLCRKVWVLRSTKVGRHFEISLKVSALLALEICAKGAQHYNKQKTILHSSKHLVMFAVNLCRKVWILRSTKVGRHFEILRKLCELLALKSCAKGAQHHNKQKTLLHACKHLVLFAVNLCRKVWVLRSTKVGRHFEISLKVSALLALESCAKGAQHHNKQKTILHASKHLVMFAVNLCRKVWVLRRTKVGRHFEISLKISALLALESCAKGAQHYNKQKTILHACKHLVMFAVNLCRKVWVLRSTKVGRHFEISLKVNALLALESCAKGAQHYNKQKTILHASKHLVMFAINLCRKGWVLRSTKVGRHFEILQKLCVLLALESCAKDAQHHNKQKTILHACKHLVIFAVNLCRKVWVLRSTKVGRHWYFIEIKCIIGSRKLCKGCTKLQQAKNNTTCL